MQRLATLLLLAAAAPGLALAQQTHGAHDGHGAHTGHGAHADHADHAEHTAHADHAAHAVQMEQASHGTPAPSPATTSATRLWIPDAPLVDGMARVGRAVATLAHLEMGHLGGSQVRTLAGDVDAAIEYMFANCRLEPEPDAALHGILARLMAASKALREAPSDAAPVATMRAALADYARLFDDPGAAAQR